MRKVQPPPSDRLLSLKVNCKRAAVSPVENDFTKDLVFPLRESDFIEKISSLIRSFLC